MENRKFPEDFLWGTGEDAYQHEGGNYCNDWYRWEQGEPSPIAGGHKMGLGPDFYNLYERDFDAAAADGQTIHRIGVEWSRLETRPGEYSEEAAAHYRRMLKALKDRGFVTVLNLWHFTLPLWAADSGGWENRSLLEERWPAFVGYCCRQFGDLTDLWSTVIDSQIYALRGYAAGDIPPGIRDVRRALGMYRTMEKMHIAGYRVIREVLGVRARIGQIYFFFDIRPASGRPADRIAAAYFDNLFNWKMLKRLNTAKTLDWLGVNYYTRQLVGFSFTEPGFITQGPGSGLEVTDMGWEIYPQGLIKVCRKLAGLLPAVPLHITECGLADAGDRLRPGFIRSHLQALLQVISEGVPVKSFSYWSSMDNWEWAEGWGPKFGLYGWDPETRERKRRPSADLFAFIAKNNRLPD